MLRLHSHAWIYMKAGDLKQALFDGKGLLLTEPNPQPKITTITKLWPFHLDM